MNASVVRQQPPPPPSLPFDEESVQMFGHRSRGYRQLTGCVPRSKCHRFQLRGASTVFRKFRHVVDTWILDSIVCTVWVNFCSGFKPHSLNFLHGTLIFSWIKTNKDGESVGVILTLTLCTQHGNHHNGQLGFSWSHPNLSLVTAFEKSEINVLDDFWSLENGDTQK